VVEEDVLFELASDNFEMTIDSLVGSSLLRDEMPTAPPVPEPALAAAAPPLPVEAAGGPTGLHPTRSCACRR
jgi:hypothetical protein